MTLPNPYADSLDRLVQRDRQQILNLILPAGVAFHLRHTFQLLDDRMTVQFGVCWHGHVCVCDMHGRWIHPVGGCATGRQCDDPPVIGHLNIGMGA